MLRLMQILLCSIYTKEKPPETITCHRVKGSNFYTVIAHNRPEDKITRMKFDKELKVFGPESKIQETKTVQKNSLRQITFVRRMREQYPTLLGRF